MRELYFTNAAMVAGKLKEYIVLHRLEHASKLPSVREMAAMFSTSKDTVCEALTILGYEGIVHVIPSKGAFVTDTAWTKLYPHSPDWDDYKRKNSFTDYTHYKNSYDPIGDKYEFSFPCHFNDDYSRNAIGDAASKVADIIRQGALDIWYANEYPPLKNSIQDWLVRNGIHVLPEQIIITAGVLHSFSIIMTALFRTGIRLLYEEPSVVHHRSSIFALQKVPLPMDNEGILKDALLKNISSKNTVLYTNSVYSYPSGITTSEQRKQVLLNICNNAEIPIIEVDNFRDLHPAPPQTYAAMDQSNSVLYLSSTSKILHSNLRVGWIVAPMNLTERLRDALFHSSNPSNLPNQIIVNELMESGKYYEYAKRYTQYISVQEKITDEILKYYLGDIAEWSALHPLTFWLKFTNGFKCDKAKFLANNLLISYGTLFGNDYSSYAAVRKVHPDLNKFEEGVRILSKLARSK